MKHFKWVNQNSRLKSHGSTGDYNHRIMSRERGEGSMNCLFLLYSNEIASETSGRQKCEVWECFIKSHFLLAEYEQLGQLYFTKNASCFSVQWRRKWAALAIFFTLHPLTGHPEFGFHFSTISLVLTASSFIFPTGVHKKCGNNCYFNVFSLNYIFLKRILSQKNVINVWWAVC